LIFSQAVVEMGDGQPAFAAGLQRRHRAEQGHTIGPTGNGQQYGHVLPAPRRPDVSQFGFDRVHEGLGRESLTIKPRPLVAPGRQACVFLDRVGATTGRGFVKTMSIPGKLQTEIGEASTQL